MTNDFPQIVQTVLDTTDVRGLAEFYRQMFGLRYRGGDEPPASGTDDAEWLVLVDSRGQRHLAFQKADELPASTWPSAHVPQQMHLDCRVPDVEALEHHRERALQLGARLVLDRREDPEEPLYVLADPAGHPFCLFVG